MVTRTTVFGGTLLVVAGLLGFIAPDFMGLHLSVAHSLLFLISGLAALGFGLLTTEAAGRTFCLVIGAFYGLSGLVGFVVGGVSYPITIISGALVFGTMDHLVHLIVGAVFFSVGWVGRPATARPSMH